MPRRRRRRGPPRLRLRDAVALGTLHGPAELLPISSTAHVELVPWLLGWEYAELDPGLRKAFEVALHAGTAAALLIALRREVGEAVHDLDRRRMVLLAGSFAPAAAAGLALERPIEQRLAGPRPIAAGLLVGAAAIAAADAAGASGRRRGEAGLGDALALGLGQACALVPGVSRNGATVAAARLRGFSRADAHALSRHVALPVIGGATALKALRLARRGLPPQALAALAAGTLASFASTLAAKRLLRDDRVLWPYAAYRSALALVVLWRAATPRVPGSPPRARRDRRRPPARSPAGSCPAGR